MNGDPRREEFKRRGRCAVCGVRKPAPGRVTCRKCLDRQAGYNCTWLRRRLDAEERMLHDAKDENGTQAAGPGS